MSGSLGDAKEVERRVRQLPLQRQTSENCFHFMSRRYEAGLDEGCGVNRATTTDSGEPSGLCGLATERRIGAEFRPLQGKRAGVIVLSAYSFDPRPRRTADVLVRLGMSVDYICVADGKEPWREKKNGMNVFRVPIYHQRGGKIGYAYQYSAFILASAAIVAARSRRSRYDLIFVNNMPDILVVSALMPKIFGAKVILDFHDPMPELMMTIFGKDRSSKSVRLLKFLEKWSAARAHQVLVPDVACRRLLGARSCPEQKIAVMMNSPDESIFPFCPAGSRRALKRKDSKPVVVMYHGTLVERNGLDITVEAFARLRNKLPTAQLHIYGKSTPFLERVMQSAIERGLRQNVLHLEQKPLEQIVAAIDSCDIGVIPNRRNEFTQINMPTRIFEYLARGKPVIAPRTAGIQDYFDEDSLFFFEAGNADELAKQIEFVASHPREALTITERGQQVYKAHTWKLEERTLIEVLGKLFKPNERDDCRSHPLPLP
jgi:glycosyltransferase involved in cell wall biosynthesis